MFGKPGNVVGLDIGSHTVKVVEIEKGLKGRKSLSKFSLARVTPGEAGKVAAVKKVMQESGIESDQVAIAVSGQSVIVRYIELPEMSEEEVKNAIKYEAERHIPFDIEEVVLDFQVLERAADLRKMRVLLVAVKKDLIDGYLKLMEATGLNPAIIDADSFALLNAFEMREEKKETVALVNMGAKLTNINIVREGIPYFTRDISPAGNDITEAIQKNLSLDLPTAEKRKEEDGEAIGDSPLFKALNPILEDLAGELRRSFDYYENQTLEKIINKVLFSGGGAQLKDLDKFLTKALGLPVSVWNPLEGLDTSSISNGQELEKHAPLLGVAIGLALREA
ncbi:MAG: type IV pilus assembly protein PilM [Nitrospirae bacterium]|nr:type IV pilus assembly protein PilM [Nitrospirota bacterium]